MKEQPTEKASTTSSLKEKTIRGLLWGGINNGLMQMFNFVFGLILGNLLGPAEYGVVGMVVFFSSMASILQEGGFISALNRKKNATQEDYSAVFWFSLFMGLGFYVLGFFCAPLIAQLFNEPRLISLARYSFLSFVIAGFGIAPKAILFRQLRVRETSAISICALLSSGTIGVVMALCGCSYWGLVTQGLVYVFVVSMLTFWRAKWCPSFRVNLTPLRSMIGYSSKLIVTNLFVTLNGNFFNFVLGVFYTPTAVGNFSQANKWTTMGHSTISGMVNGVAQPLFTKVEEEKERQVVVFRKLLRFTALFSFPALFGLSLVAPELIVIAIGKVWADSASILRVLCVWGAFVPLCTIFSNYLLARGKSGAYMWCTLSLLLVQILVVSIASLWGMEMMFRLFVVVNVGWLFVWHWLVQREVPLRLRHIIGDLAPYLLLSSVLCLIAHFVFTGVGSIYWRLIGKILAVAFPYIGILYCSGSVILREGIAYLLKRKR